MSVILWDLEVLTHLKILKLNHMLWFDMNKVYKPKGLVKKNLTHVLFCGFLGFLGIKKIHLGHFSTALST